MKKDKHLSRYGPLPTLPTNSKLFWPEYSDHYVMRGTKQIADVYHGDASKHRSINYLVKKGRFPHFREGTTRICARVGTLRRWIMAQEEDATKGVRRSPDQLVAAALGLALA